MALLVKLGICELAVAALSGWAMVLMVERPETLKRAGFRHLGRIRQAHLDLIFMGTIVSVREGTSRRIALAYDQTGGRGDPDGSDDSHDGRSAAARRGGGH
jgi:hypothetical protein